MPPKKRSFFDRLAGSLPAEDFDGYDDETLHTTVPTKRSLPLATTTPSPQPYPTEEEDDAEGQLPVDVYQTANEIVIHAFVAGVRPEEMNVSISRDVVEIDGSRKERDHVSEEDYVNRELFWGSFTRTILLPQEIDVDTATAGSKDGLLTIVLPKLDKTRQTKLRVRAG